MLAKTTNAIQQAIWPVQNVQAFTTSRTHPFKLSKNPQNIADDPYNFFNLGLHVGDSSINVEQNRSALLKLLPNNSQIQWLEQVHGNEVKQLTAHSIEPIKADAVITKNKGLALAIMTADCLPILLSNKEGSEIAAIHGGWRPLSQNIISNTVSKMTSENEQLYAWLGPCIGKQAFEVGKEVKDAFLKLSPEFSKAFIKIEESPLRDKPNKFFANLQCIATIQLQQLGITHISYLAHCTHTMSDSYYSYRRENVTGRMATIICRT